MSNSEKAWFKPKKYGYGFYPISFEGWVVTVVFIGAIFFAGYIDGIFLESASSQNGLRFLFDVMILAFHFFLFAKDKTKGKLQWNWGNNETE